MYAIHSAYGINHPRARAARPVPVPWLALGLLTVAFLAFSLPPYLTLDPAQARLPVPTWYYPALAAHIAFGSIALLAACVQLWPWFRAHRRAMHRWSGRVYVFAGALPASLVVLTITRWARGAPTSGFGPSRSIPVQPSGRIARTCTAVIEPRPGAPQVQLWIASKPASVSAASTALAPPG